MKKIYIVFLLALATFNFSNAQVKILFDASKAETAGSADWVIDADLHNLGYSSGPASVGGGDESNAQRVPTPAQSSITSSTAETYWKGSLSSWGIDMVKKGYYVETLPYNGQITYGNSNNAQDLSNYKVFIVDEPNIRFTSAEKTAMMNFVQNGGGLFMVSDHNGSDRNNDGWDSPHIWNDFMDTNTVHPFGIHFDYANFSGTSTNVANLPGNPLLHGIMGNVTEVDWSNGTSMTLNTSNNSSVKGVVFKTGASTTGTTNVLVAYATYGSGRVAAIGDSSPTDDGTGDPNDQLYNGWTGDANGNHEKLIVNATIWLASGTTSIDEINDSSYDIILYPNPIGYSASFNISAPVNIGNSSIIIYDMLGREVKRISNLQSHYIELNRDNLERGMYIYKFYTNRNIIKIAKFMVE
jgi:hypothetical protein